MHLSVIAMVLLAAAAPEVPAVPLTNVEHEAREQARREVTDLLQALCPEQCLLLSVSVRVEDERVGIGAPGFEGISPTPSVPRVASVSAVVLADEQLPSAFRTGLRDLVIERLKLLQAPTRVAVQSMRLPPRNAPHLQAPDAKPPAAEPPAPARQPEPSPPAAAPERSVGQVLVEAAPLLVVAALLALVLLVVAALLYVAIRRATLPDEVIGPAERDPEPASVAAADAPRIHRLTLALAEDRGARNAILREALEAGEASLVAQWCRALGESLLDDVRGDRSLATALSAVAAGLRRPPPAGEGSARALDELEARLLSARLGHGSESVEGAFAFLEGVGLERFLAATGALGPQAREVALRFAPVALRNGTLQRLPAGERERVALDWIRRPAIDAAYARAVARELEQAVGAVAGAGRGPQLVTELLRSLSRTEQDALVGSLMAAQAGALPPELVTESMLLSAGDTLISAAALSAGHGTLVAFLGGAEPQAREAVLRVLPGRVRREMVEELEGRAAVAPSAYLAAREELLARLRQELEDRGGSLAELAARVHGERAKLASNE